MKIVKRIIPCLLLFLPILLCTFTSSEAKEPASAKRIEVKNIRFWSNPDYTRIVIDVSGATTYKEHLLKEDPSIKKPPRLFIDFSNAVTSPNLKRALRINDGLLKSVRTGQYDSDTVRVVLDIESIGEYRIFPLEEPFRIVVDVMAKGSAKPSPPAVASKRTVKKSSPPTHTEGVIGRIIIDPGHGGKDPGAVGRRGLKEKDVNLKIARKLKQALKRRFKGKIILTRERDRYIPLEERTAIANTKGADLFLSIHANASPNRKARGVETYYLNFTTDEEAIRLSARENSTSAKQMSDLQFILNDLMKTAKTNESVRLAANIQESIVSRLRKRYRRINGNGIKGAPFYVLVGTQMPSVLIEVSFISNREEETRLKTDAYLNGIVQGIATGLLAYINGDGVSAL
ncbi:MAG: N-acetylmuramoyl-L-alanine amidase [Thermodesulfobacteriota bacterium]